MGAEFISSRHEALVAETRHQGEKLIIAKPLTYMNLSGRAVRSLVHWYKLQPEDIIIVYDDIDLPVGRLRIRGQGSAGGQKGMASVIETLGTEGLLRVRVGIGRPPEGWTAPDYVLAPFSAEEWQVMQEILPLAAEAALALTWQGLDQVMNRYNR
ncbi:MAG: aminoacyl-tRNA hydrolase [Clostridia bacterium]|nr:aminoacyl-tRNA hydrolase [Clostridia bacterium]